MGATTHLRDVGARSARGLLREYNADHFVVAELDRNVSIRASNMRGLEPIVRAQGTLMMVASAVSSRGSGSLASRAKLGALLEYAADRLPWHLHDAKRPQLLRRFASALARSERAQRETCLSRHAAPLPTATGLVFVDDAGLFAVRSGATRCYRAHEGSVECLDRPADLVVPASDQHPEVEAHYREVASGDRLLLCTHGVWRVVPRPAIERILRESEDAREASNELLLEVRRAGGRDDATVVAALV